MNERNRVAAILAAMVFVLFVGSVGMVAASGGYTETDLAFFSHVEAEKNVLYYMHYDADYCVVGGVAAFYYQRLALEAQRQVNRLDMYPVSDNVEKAKFEYKNYIINMRTVGTEGVKCATLGSEADTLLRDGSLQLAEDSIYQFSEELKRILNEGMQSGVDNFFYITPGDAVDISVNIPYVNEFIRGAETAATFEVRYFTGGGAIQVWLVRWTRYTPMGESEDIAIVVDVRTGEVHEYN